MSMQTATSLKLPITSPLSWIFHEQQLKGRDVLGISNLSVKDIQLILDVAALLKANKSDELQSHLAKGKTMIMLFEKPSLRTRVAFETGFAQLGGTTIFMEGPIGSTHIKKEIRESLGDIARNLNCWVDVIIARTFSQATIEELAIHAQIPVINALSDLEHPCQALADMQTIQEHKGKLKGLKIAFIGDGNNVASSLMLCASKLGVNFTLAAPTGYTPPEKVIAEAKTAALQSGATVTITENPFKAVTDADVIYTDTWVSMGWESETLVRQQVFTPYQVNKKLLEQAPSEAIVMHCLPAHRGEEITDEVLDGPRSVVLDQATNRLHIHKALLSLIL